MKYTYRIFEDNAGNLHLAVLSEGKCVYYLTDSDRGFVLDTLDAFKNGGDPISDYWEGGEDDPEACYHEIIRFEEANNGSAFELSL